MSLFGNLENIPGFTGAIIVSIVLILGAVLAGWKVFPYLSEKRRREVSGLLLSIFAILLGISILSFSIKDSKILSGDFSGFNDGRIHNWMGIAGHLSGGFLLQLFGIGAVLIPIMIIILGIDLLKSNRIEGKWSFLYIWIIGLLSFSSLTQKISSSLYGGTGGNGVYLEHFDCFAGGIAGKELNAILELYTGEFGAFILPFVIMFLNIVLLTDIGPGRIIEFIGKPLKKFSVFMGNTVKSIKQRKSNKERKHPVYRKNPRLTGKKAARVIDGHSGNEQVKRKGGGKSGNTGSTVKSERKVKLSENNRNGAVKESVEKKDKESGGYRRPPVSLLNKSNGHRGGPDRKELNEQADILERTLASYGIECRVTRINPGPIITSYEVKPAAGIKINRIVNLADDLAMTLKAKRIRIVAPIPGKSVVGVEVPNREPETVFLRDIVSHKIFKYSDLRIPIAMGKTTTGEPYVVDLAETPHLLIAGATGSGKSVCINTIICSILFRFGPDQVKFIMIDPKILELTLYNRIPHLLSPVITSHENVMGALQWAVYEMEHRYRKLAALGVRNIDDYNRRVVEMRKFEDESDGPLPETLPYIIIIVDELADLVVTVGHEIDIPIARLAQKARAVGIHLILATQRPSVNVITGTIKANFPSRIAFQVATRIDSRTIIDGMGADKLLGKGDMLFMDAGRPELERLHGALISGDEVKRIVGFIINQGLDASYIKLHDPSLKDDSEKSDGSSGLRDLSEKDPLYQQALQLVVLHQQGSISLLQRRLKIGYSRAARLIDQLESAGIVGEFDGSKAREVLVDENYLDELQSGDNSEPQSEEIEG